MNKEEHSVYVIKFYAMQKQIDDLKKDNKKIKEEKDHYKHLYSELKKQKDDVVEYIKTFKDDIRGLDGVVLLRMLGEIDDK